MQTHFPEQRLVVKPTVLWKSSTKPLGGLVHFKPIWGGGLFHLEKVMVFSIRTRIQSRKGQVQEGWRSCSRGSESNPNFQLVNIPLQISPHQVLQS